MNVGFVGLGDQGLPIAIRLSTAGGWSTVVWARRPASLEPLRDANVVVAGSLAELGACSGIVGICVSDDAAVDEVVTTVVPAMRPGTTVLIHSTVLPDTVRRLALWAAEQGIDLIDAPVSGGSDAALEGRMAVLVGGPQEVLERVRPMLAHFATTIALLGPVGAGEAAKLVNNVLMMANGGVLLEALASGTEAGVERSDLIDAIAASSGGSYVLNRLGRHSSAPLVAHVAALLRKDLNLFEQMSGGSYGLLIKAAWRYVDHLEAILREME
ncbi:MAG: 3-hydroxyisobutyrate dehydrogenase [Acidimicrobiaceae bacterium]|nr:3-hydroxyisobutyrate dehydrogenase [Acidimicrobiaceae bacterium]